MFRLLPLLCSGAEICKQLFAVRCEFEVTRCALSLCKKFLKMCALEMLS